MQRIRRKQTKNQPHVISPARAVAQQAMPLDDGTVTTPVTLAMIQALIPLGLRAVEDALLEEVQALAGSRYARDDQRPEVVRWGAQGGSIYLADQKLPITVPRVRDQRARREVPLATYAALQMPRTQDVGLFRRVLGGLSCREYEGAAEAVPAGGEDAAGDTVAHERPEAAVVCVGPLGDGTAVSPGERLPASPLVETRVTEQTFPHAVRRGLSRIISGIACFSTTVGTHPLVRVSTIPM